MTKKTQKKTYFYKNQKLKSWLNSTTQILTKIKNPNCEKEKGTLWQIWQNSIYDKPLKQSFSKNNLTPQQPIRWNHGIVLRSRDVFFLLSQTAQKNTVN